MTIDPTLWEAFHRAKNNIFAAFKEDLAQTTSHILLRKPADRVDAQSAVQNREVDLNEDLQKVILVEKEFLSLKGYAVKAIARVQNSLSPIAALPIELLTDILTRLEPREHKAILTLASVCDLWRDVMHNARLLWSDADWNAWPLELLEVWCSRARGYPMTVRLAEDGVNAIYSSPGFTHLLQSTKRDWNVLESNMSTSWNNANETWCCTVYTSLFKDPLPSLVSLSFVGPPPSRWDTPAELPMLSAPNIHTLAWKGAFPPPFSEPLPHLRNISLTPTSWSQWWALLPALASSPHINQMAISYSYLPYPRFRRDNHPKLTYPSLDTIEILGFGDDHVPYSLGTMSFPKLSEIVIVDSGDEEYAGILSFLVSSHR